MKVELLHIADCPNTEVARRLVEEALRELGLCDKITEVEVSDPMQAERLHFPGSPTVRVGCGGAVATPTWLWPFVPNVPD
jgi:hypothetical protein